MPRIRTVVAATDFSDSAERAVQRAARIAGQHGAALHLLHVVRPLDLFPSLTLPQQDVTQQDQDVLELEQSRLSALAAALASQFGIRVQAFSRLGRPHSEIADYARDVSADLVAIGARGENTLMDLFLGSTASRLLRVAPCPVLIVRKPGEEAYREVLAAVDFSPVSAEVLGQAIGLAGGARVRALHVLGSETEQRLRRAKYDQVDITDWLARQRREAEKQLEALLAPIAGGAVVERVVHPGFPPAAICQWIDDKAIDLAVLGRHGHGGGLQEWLLGSVSKDVAFAAACDVLLIGAEGP